jgi:sodium-independent sulfate anion transporter 11
LEARQPARKKMWSIMSSLRLTFAMLLYTLVSFLVNRNSKEAESKFRIVGHINQGTSTAQSCPIQALIHHRFRPRWTS